MMPEETDPAEATFRTDRLRGCYEQYREGERTWGKAVARKYIERINILKRCATPQDVRTFRKLRLHKLAGEYEGQHAISLDERRPLHVTFEGGPPLLGSAAKQGLARIEEVTRHYGD
jgi:plasmid maintenance system killer protein